MSPEWLYTRGCIPIKEATTRHGSSREREFFIDNLLVRIHLIIVMIRWTGLAPWEFEFPFPGSLTSTFLGSSTFCKSQSQTLTPQPPTVNPATSNLPLTPQPPTVNPTFSPQIHPQQALREGERKSW